MHVSQSFGPAGKLLQRIWAAGLRLHWRFAALGAAPVLLAGLLLPLLAGAGSAGAKAAPDEASRSAAEKMSTPEHLRLETWWPTKPAAARTQYAGAARCAECHRAIAAEQATSQMAHTLVAARDSAVGRANPHLAYDAGPYHYLLERSAHDLTMRVGDGTEQRSAVMEWAFGSGDVGQSYAWRDSAGHLLESRFNYFATVHGLAETPGRLAGPPVSLDMATGRPLEAFEAKTCFACHTSAMFPGELAAPGTMIAGVSCEACHGPGAEHVRAMEQRRRSGANAAGQAATGTGGAALDVAIVNSAHMSPTRAVEMCGACHGTPWDVRLSGAVGVQTVRFPAYRLEKSRCWGLAGDDRLKCAACHDPHGPLERNIAAYDSACLACHANRTGPVQVSDAEHAGKACPVATSKCASCHMQKFELPEMHSHFTDHQIRIARAGEPFPN